MFFHILFYDGSGRVSLAFLRGFLYNNSMKKAIRQPQQERSTEKKNKIIQASYEVFSEVGYFGANTSEIAKRAGVSTGIVYSYFTDKRDILLYVLEIYLDKVTKPLMALFDSIAPPFDFSALIPKIVDMTIDIHRDNAHMHDTLHSLAATDKEVGAEFIRLEGDITYEISNKLTEFNPEIEHPIEKVHLAMDMIQSFAHEYVFDNHRYIDYDVMKRTVIDALVALFAEK